MGERKSKTDAIYENTDDIKGQITKGTENLNTTEIPPPELTESDSVRITIRAALVCLALLCFLLLAAVIVLSVFIYTNNTNYTEERRQLQTNITDLTDDRAKLLINFNNLTKVIDQLLINFTEGRNQLQTSIDNLKDEKDKQLTSFTEEKRQLQTSINNLKNRIDQLVNNFTEERNQQLANIANIREERQLLINDLLRCHDGWTYNQFSLYYLSNEMKSWSESRRDCIERGADLIIINNKQEQAFAASMTIEQSQITMQDYLEMFWIGLTNSNEEGSWKWVDGSALTSGFSYFWSGEIYSFREDEDCATVDFSSKWTAFSCNHAFKWICEKRIGTPLLL